jgi:cytochrome c biogenesis protein ResB
MKRVIFLTLLMLLVIQSVTCYRLEEEKRARNEEKRARNEEKRARNEEKRDYFDPNCIGTGKDRC